MALSPEEFAKLKARLSGKVIPEQPIVEAPKPDLTTRLADIGTGASAQIQEQIAGTGQYADKGAVERGVGATATAFGVVPQAALAMTPEPVRNAAETVGKGIGGALTWLTDKLGSTELAQNFVTQHPDAAKTLESMAGTTAGLGEIAGSILAVEGGVKTLTKSAPIVKSVVSSAQNVLDTGISTLKSVPSGVASGVSKLTPDAEAIMQRVARIPKGKQAGFEQMAGESVGSYLDKRGIYGNTEKISQQLSDRFMKSKAVADEAIASLPGEFKATPIKTALNELMQREKRISSPGVLSADFKTVQGLLSRYNKSGLTMKEINEVKRLYERNVRLEYKKSLGSSPDDIARSTTLDTALRNWQFMQAQKLGLKNLPEINKETRLARQLLDDIGKENAGIAGNNAMTLTDWIMLSGGDPAAISGFLVKKGFSNKDVQSWIAKNVSKNKVKIPEPSATLGAPKPGLQEFMNATQPLPQSGGISPVSSPNPTTFSPEVQRILNMRP